MPGSALGHALASSCAFALGCVRLPEEHARIILGHTSTPEVPETLEICLIPVAPWHKMYKHDV
eukprot:1137080-Pelagomonas_calceolata.AAC.3